MAVDYVVAALIIIAEQIVVRGIFLVFSIIIPAEGNGLPDYLCEFILILDKLGQNTKAPFGCFIKKDIWFLFVSHEFDPDFPGFDLKNVFNGPFYRILESNNTIVVKSKGFYWFYIECIRSVMGEELYSSGFLCIRGRGFFRLIFPPA